MITPVISVTSKHTVGLLQVTAETAVMGAGTTTLLDIFNLTPQDRVLRIQIHGTHAVVTRAAVTTDGEHATIEDIYDYTYGDATAES